MRSIELSAALTDMTTDALIELDKDGTVLFLNEKARKLLQLKPGMVANHRCFRPVSHQCRRQITLGDKNLEVIARPDGDHMLFCLRNVEVGTFDPLFRGSIQIFGTLTDESWHAMEPLLDDDFLMQNPERSDMASSLYHSHFALRRLQQHMEMFSLMEKEDIPVFIQTVDIYRLCRDLADSATALVEKLGHRVLFSAKSGNYDGAADPHLIETALLNLITNAIAASPEGMDVIMQLSETATNYVITVTDHGSGLSEEQLNRLYEPGGEPLGHSLYRSAGLGLFITHRIAKLHNGTLVARTNTGDETTFAFSIPKINPLPISLFCPPSTYHDRGMFLLLTELAPVLDSGTYTAKMLD